MSSLVEKEKGDEARFFKKMDEDLKNQMRAKLDEILNSEAHGSKAEVIELLSPKTEKKSFISSIGLDDWKFALPIGLVTAQAAIANEVLIFDVQSQMGCIFMFTIATLYSQASGAIAKSLDDYSADIRNTVTQVDAETLSALNDSVAENQKLIELQTDIANLHALSDDLAVAQADVLNHQNQHKYREAIAKKLDSLVAIEEAAVNSIRTRMVTKVKADVLKSFSAEKKTKEAALTQAIAVLAAGVNSKLGKDVVGEEFTAALNKYKAEYAKLPKGSDEILVQLEKDLAAAAAAPLIETEGDVYSDSFILGNTIKV